MGSSSDSHDSRAGLPLEGIVIADFSRVLAGPYATMLLGDLGAEVIKVEGPQGDDTRSWVPPKRPDGVSTYYASINRNKKSIALDFKDAEDLQTAQELAFSADVIIENFKPGGLEKFGLDYDSVIAQNPTVIYSSITGFGTRGEGAKYPGYDLIVQAMSGLMSLTGDPEGTPYRAGISVFDVMAGLHSTIGILAALRLKDQTGEGTHVEASLMASALSGLVNQTHAYVGGGVTPMRMGNAHPSLYPYEAMPTADDDVIIACGNNSQFKRLCEVLGIPEIAEDERFADVGDRTDRRSELHPILVAELSKKTAADLFTELNAVGVPCGPINTISQGVEYAQDLGLEPIVDVGSGEGTVPGVRHPLSFNTLQPRYELPPPTLGEHTDEIKNWLKSLRNNRSSS
ncbi:CaiB/BaiF CoA transferase family protein [Nesterenkonia haasae]|uniref:CaiB/BaiF CoA transferase family protein n=1 Tax=Nesterenkonia haasae TaxID=2587813 RepID=UPI0013915A6B|nr:CoA transferase [Nesterenkonia haasae]NDK32551.1 CoA transferase [Nesterenkonia haasae]